MKVKIETEWDRDYWPLFGIRLEAEAVQFAIVHNLDIEPAGSRWTVNPPVLDTDEDYVVFASVGRNDLHALQDELVALGWEKGGSEVGEAGTIGDGWASYRKGAENLILFWDRNLFDYFKAATQLAKVLNLRDKEDRVKLFTTLEYLWPGLRDDIEALIDDEGALL